MNSLMLATYVLKLQAAEKARMNQHAMADGKRRLGPRPETLLAISVVVFGVIAAFAPVA